MSRSKIQKQEKGAGAKTQETGAGDRSRRQKYDTGTREKSRRQEPWIETGDKSKRHEQET